MVDLRVEVLIYVTVPNFFLPACVKSKHETGDLRSPRKGGGGEAAKIERLKEINTASASYAEKCPLQNG